MNSTSFDVIDQESLGEDNLGSQLNKPNHISNEIKVWTGLLYKRTKTDSWKCKRK